MYEEGQAEEEQTDENPLRIIRIGKANDLNKRLKNHFKGKIKDSVFRRHIFSSLKDYEKNEEKVSDYIKTNISFNLIYVPKMLNVEELEKRMIRTVAKYSKELNVSNWLGKNCNNKKVQNYNIWNSDDVEYEYTLDKNYFDLIECGLVRK